MITIKPILEKDLDAACRWYLTDLFQTRHFGTLHLLHCQAGQPAKLIPISQAEASKLLNGEQVDGIIPDNQRVGAWRFSFIGSQSLSVLYALAPERYAARIETGHFQAAHTALGELAGCLLDDETQKGYMGMLLDAGTMPAPSSTGEPLEARQNGTRHTREQAPECVYLVFNSPVGPDLRPQLETTAFLVNWHYCPPRPPRALASAKDIYPLLAPLSEANEGALNHLIFEAIGPFKRAGNTNELRIAGVPQTAVQKFFFDSPFNQLRLHEQNLQDLPKHELVAQWRAQGERVGWGAKQAEQLLRTLERERICDAVHTHIQATFKDLEWICSGAKDSAKRLLKSERSMPIGHKHKSKDQDWGHSY